MTATVTIQETELRPATEGVGVRLYISDAPRDGEAPASFALDLRVTVPKAGTARVAGVQLMAVAAAVDILQGLRSDLHQEANRT